MENGRPQQRVVILGAGPTGLGAGWRLHEVGYSNWAIYEAEVEAGGLASSAVDEKGFIWDLGGHVIFSHYEYFDRLLDSLLGKDGWLEHVRESWVWMRDRYIPYPLQNNIWRLPPQDLIKCLDGLLDVYKSGVSAPPKNVHDWIMAFFGQGLADVFMLPYNFKVWAYPAREMGAGWMGERVALVDMKRITTNMVLQRDDVSWGPNARFRFPLRGGTGAIWKALYERLPKEKIHLGKRVVRIDSAAQVIHFSDGTSDHYDRLMSTIPLDTLIHITEHPNASLKEKAGQLKYSSSHIIGIGVEGQIPDSLKTKCWLYFPEDNCPFYRATVFSNYSPYNVPKPGEQWSLMMEVSESPCKPVDVAKVIEDTIQGCRNTGLLPPDANIVSTWHRRLEHGYPTPFFGRDELLAQILPELRKVNIWSRGRFGGWKYEVANQDHSMMQGVEAVDNILFGSEELTLEYPNVVNAKKSTNRVDFSLKVNTCALPPAAQQ